MPKFNDMFPSKWLAAADLNDQDCTLTIAGIDSELIGQGEEAEQKYVVYFQEIRKGLVLNKTNGKVLVKVFGDDTDEWVSKRVVLYPTEVDFGGKMVDAIRIKTKATEQLQKQAKPMPAKASKVPAPAVTQAEADAGDDGEDIPF